VGSCANNFTQLGIVITAERSIRAVQAGIRQESVPRGFTIFGGDDAVQKLEDNAFHEIAVGLGR